MPPMRLILGREIVSAFQRQTDAVPSLLMASARLNCTDKVEHDRHRERESAKDRWYVSENIADRQRFLVRW